MQQLLVQDLQSWLNDPGREPPFLLDVREPWEFDRARIEGATLVPMHLIPVRFEELDRDRDTVVICHHGSRSLQVAYFLEGRGFHRIHNLRGGVDAWAREVDPTVRRY